MKISLIHPSRSRPQQAAATAKAWLSSAANPSNIEYVLSMDVSDPERYKYVEIISQLGLPDAYSIKPLTSDNHSAIEAINNAAKIATGDLLIQIAEDFNTPPFHWDAYLIDELKGKSDYVAKIDDGLQPFIITLPILDRKWYDRHGYIYHPDFEHMYCDSALSCKAWMEDKYITLPIKILHNHYSTGRTQKDAVNIKADSTYGSGKQTFLRHYHNNFGLQPNEIKKELPKWSGFVNFK